MGTCGTFGCADDGHGSRRIGGGGGGDGAAETEDTRGCGSRDGTRREGGHGGGFSAAECGGAG